MQRRCDQRVEKVRENYRALGMYEEAEETADALRQNCAANRQLLYEKLQQCLSRY
jgi:hypothetical protein